MKLKSIAKNQTEINTTLNQKPLTVFFSYSTPVAYIYGKSHGKTSTKFSTTTTRHVNAFFNRHGIDHKGVALIEQSTIDNLI